MDFWVYPLLEVLDVHDGDTFKGKLDLGFGRDATETFRLYGIDAPELHGPERGKALEATAHLKRRLAEARQVAVQTHERGNFGRWLATVYCDGASVNQELLDRGLAVPYPRRK